MNPKTDSHRIQPYRFNKEADEELERVYKAVGASTTEQKINTLGLHLGGIGSFSTDNKEIMLGALEYEYLISKNLITLTLA